MLLSTHVMRTCYLQGTNSISELLTILFRTPPFVLRLPWGDTNPVMLDLSQQVENALLSEVAARTESIGACRVSASSPSQKITHIQLKQTRQSQAA